MEAFSYLRKVNYYETDAMGIVHHSNHLRLFEEARVDWFRKRGMSQLTWQESEMFFPLLESSVKYFKPLLFDDDIEVRFQARQQGRRFYCRYAIYVVGEGADSRKNFAKDRGDLPILAASGETLHTLVDKNFRVVKTLDPKIIELMEAEPWTEIWP